MSSNEEFRPFPDNLNPSANNNENLMKLLAAYIWRTAFPYPTRIAPIDDALIDNASIDDAPIEEAPIDDLNMHTEALTGLTIENQKANDAIKGIMKATALIKSRLEAAEHGPRTVLDAEDERQRLEVDPTIQDKRILIADDEPAIRTAVCKVLEQQGCQVTVCGDGNETLKALEIASRADVFFDLVITDIKMPNCSGYDVFQATHQVCADTPVILMTGFGYDPDHSIVRASQEGLGGFLFKPFNRSQLLEAVSRALAQSESDSTH